MNLSHFNVGKVLLFKASLNEKQKKNDKKRYERQTVYF